MPNLYEIIQQIQKDLYCPVCGKNYKIGELRVRGLFDKTLIVQSVCINGHMTFFMTTLNKVKGEASPINTNDVLDLHNILTTFDGDFDSLWKK